MNVLSKELSTVPNIVFIVADDLVSDILFTNHIIITLVTVFKY